MFWASAFKTLASMHSYASFYFHCQDIHTKNVALNPDKTNQSHIFIE